MHVGRCTANRRSPEQPHVWPWHELWLPLLHRMHGLLLRRLLGQGRANARRWLLQVLQFGLVRIWRRLLQMKVQLHWVVARLWLHSLGGLGGPAAWPCRRLLLHARRKA